MSDQDRERIARFEAETEDAPRRDPSEQKKYTRRSFLTGGAAAVAGVFGFRYIQNMETEGRAPLALRRTHELNERIWRGLFREEHLAPEFEASEASVLRVNGRHGIREEIAFDEWQFTVEGPDGSVVGTHVLDDIKALPKYEMTIEHKCVEGWSQITTWGGARFSDFAALYPDLAGAEFVAMETPDGEYYVGNERATMMHPQTLLVYEMVGQPLDSEHGAPLRMATPLKYGIKQLKRIGVIRFTDEQPADYWAERGYDYYSLL
jgi:DMSO/TMAO reductase YedYZ molybdopterin-dependent catalytic subunit